MPLVDAAAPTSEFLHKPISISHFSAKTEPMETKFLDTLAQHLLTNHNIYVYHAAEVEACSQHDKITYGEELAPMAIL